MSRPTKPDNINSETMPANTWGKLRSYLAQEGYSQAEITAIIGGNVGGRNKYEIVQTLMENL